MNRIKKSDATKTLLAFVFIALIFIPLVNMFMYMDKESVDKVVSSPVFGTAVKNSLASTLVSTVITVVLAFALAMSIERSSIKFKKIFSVLFSLPMLVPSISIGMGLTILFGNNGILTKFFCMSQGIYGFGGIVMGSVLYAFPVA
ncbi:MAG: phosphonate ABC transporter permease, partial [Lachnospiraceae bacterium]|nr:phosphonate ABC transporter permease [Lachnospiraceae bacterium]